MAMYLGDQKVRITDKSKTNLLDVFNRTEGKLTSGGSNTSLRSDIEFDKYYVGMTANNYYYPQQIKEAKVDSFMKTVFVSSLSGGYGISFPVKCEPNKIYTYSAETVGIFNFKQGFLRVGFYRQDRSYISFVSEDVRNFLTFTTPENCGFMTIICAAHKGQEVLFTNICLVEGSFSGTTFTNYEPYNNKLQPPMIRANNLIPYPYLYNGGEYAGLSYTVLDDGGVKVSGTKETAANISLNLTKHYNQIGITPGVDYFIKCDSTSGLIKACVIIEKPDGKSRTVTGCFKLEYGEKIRYFCLLSPYSEGVGYTFDEIVYPMLNEGSVPLPFRPYSEEPEYIY